MSTTLHADVSAWLASADPDPNHAHRWWTAQEIALLPLGRAWDVVRIDGIPEVLSVDGPIISDLDGAVLYFLVPVGTARTWDVPGTEALGDTAYLTIPALGRTTPPGPHWLQPPSMPGHLVSPEQLHDALQRGNR